MRLACLLLVLALPQAHAGPDNAGACATYVVESGCSEESKSCMALFKKEDLPKGKECGTPQKGLKWTVTPEELVGAPKACQKESAALAEKANKGDLKGLCYVEKVNAVY